MGQGVYNGYLANASYGARFLDLPASNVTTGQTLCRQVQIDGVKYDVNLPIENTAQIASLLSGLGLGTYTCVNQTTSDPNNFDIYKTSRDQVYPQAVSISYINEITGQEVEIVRAFELLDSVVDVVETEPIYQLATDNCITQDEYDGLLLQAQNVCPDCC